MIETAIFIVLSTVCVQNRSPLISISGTVNGITISGNTYEGEPLTDKGVCVEKMRIVVGPYAPKKGETVKIICDFVGHRMSSYIIMGKEKTHIYYKCANCGWEPKP